jgi:hypothetical protein
VEDLQIRSALGAYPCCAWDEIRVQAIDDQYDADRRACFDIELTALTSPRTKRYLHQQAAEGQHPA